MLLFERYVAPPVILVFAFEGLLIPAALFGAALLVDPSQAPPALLGKILLVGLLCQLCLYYNDFYDLHVAGSGSELVGRLVQGAGGAAIVLGIIYLIMPSVALQTSAFLWSLSAVILVVLPWRVFFNVVSRTSSLVEPTLVIGTGPSAQRVANELAEHHAYATRVVGLVDDGCGSEATGPVPIVGGFNDLRDLIAREHVTRIVVGGSLGRTRCARALVDAKLSGVVVEDAVSAYERFTGKVLLEEWRLDRLVLAEGFRVSSGRRLLKRSADLVLSTVGLVIAAPLIVLTALLVWVGSGRPLLYRQDRVGQHGSVFILYKFRSMRNDAEADGPRWAAAQDDRVTLVGRFIRLTRLDELPQLWNVMSGDMSFVGPRPERPVFVEDLRRQIPFYDLRHAVKPGITGWAQVKYRYADSVEAAAEKLRYDLYYIKHFSPTFDLTIVLDTVKTILFRLGAQ